MNKSKCSIYKRILICITFPLVILLLLNSIYTLRPHDLLGSKLYIHNATCSSSEIVRTVEDEALYQELVSICTNAVTKEKTIIDEDYYSSYPSEDYMLGIPDRPFLWFTQDNSGIRYEITLESVRITDRQSSFENSEPTILIEMWKLDKSSRPYYYLQSWFCNSNLPQKKYERLCDLILDYSGGEETTWLDIKKDMVNKNQETE